MFAPENSTASIAADAPRALLSPLSSRSERTNVHHLGDAAGDWPRTLKRHLDRLAESAFAVRNCGPNTERIHGRCRSPLCLWCGPIEGALTAGALALARPDRHVRISLVGDDWPVIQQRLGRLIPRIRRRGYDWRWAYSIEPNPHSLGAHIHAWQCGSHVPQHVLQMLCEEVGVGQPWIAMRTAPDGAPLGYGMKLATAIREMPLDAAREQLQRFVDLNGGRLIHASRYFWRDRFGNPVTLRRAQQSYWQSLVTQRDRSRR